MAVVSGHARHPVSEESLPDLIVNAKVLELRRKGVPEIMKVQVNHLGAGKTDDQYFLKLRTLSQRRTNTSVSARSPGGVRAVVSTVAPAARNRAATARLIPLVPPVTSA